MLISNLLHSESAGAWQVHPALNGIHSVLFPATDAESKKSQPLTKRLATSASGTLDGNATTHEDQAITCLSFAMDATPIDLQVELNVLWEKLKLIMQKQRGIDTNKVSAI